jgi:hypothetical protein
MVNDPERYLEYRRAVENEVKDGFPFFIHGTKAQADAKMFSIQDMSQRLAPKPELKDLMIPGYPVGCRRPTPRTGYLEGMMTN